MHFAIFMNNLFGLDFLVLQVSTFFLNHQKWYLVFVLGCNQI
jgi:hypothetical protein